MAESHPLQSTESFARDLSQTVQDHRNTPGSFPEKQRVAGRRKRDGFWARVMAVDSDGKHTVERQKPSDNGKRFEPISPVFTADYVYEVNDKSAEVDAYIWIFLSGFDDSGNPLYLFVLPPSGASDNPDTIGADDENEAAATDSWDRDNQGDTTGVTVTCLSRIAYDDTSDQTLYAYYRDYKYDSLGYLYEVTQETRVTIDTPEAC